MSTARVAEECHKHTVDLQCGSGALFVDHIVTAGAGFLGRAGPLHRACDTCLVKGSCEALRCCSCCDNVINEWIFGLAFEIRCVLVTFFRPNYLRFQSMIATAPAYVRMFFQERVHWDCALVTARVG